MPMIILKPAYEKITYESLNKIDGEDSHLFQANSGKTKNPRKYELRVLADITKKASKPTGDTSQDSILHDLDSISRIYNELETV